MERLTRSITPVGMCQTTLNSMKHYMPCVVCRDKAEIKIDSKGKGYTEKYGFCDTCEVKMLFNRLKDYEDAEEQGLLLRLPCKVGDTVWEVEEILPYTITECKVDKFATDEAGVMYINYHSDNFGAKRYLDAFGDTLFTSKEEAEQKLESMKKE